MKVRDSGIATSKRKIDTQEKIKPIIIQKYLQLTEDQLNFLNIVQHLTKAIDH